MNGSDQPIGGASDPSEREALDILLIEDNPADARLFEEHLKESVIQATLRHERTVETGLEALRTGRPDVLVVDLGLPDSDGSEAVEAVVGAAPKLPIVVLTGRDDLEVALQVQEAGAAEYLQKADLSPTLLGRTLQWSVRRSRMQQKLRQRDAWIRSITEGLSAGVFRTGPTGRIEYANEALVGLLGFDREEALIGRDLTEFYANSTDQGRILAEEEARGVEVKFKREDGTTFVGLLSAEAAYDAGGTPTHYDGTITDVTEQKEKEQQLRVLSKAVEQAKESVIITEAAPLDRPGPRIEYVNRAYEEMTGYSRDEAVGKTPRILQGEKTDREVLDSLRGALEAGEDWEGETVNYRKDGTPYRVQWNVSPVEGEDGSIGHWVSVQRDVTEERRQEEALRERETRLRGLANSIPGVVYQFVARPGGEAGYEFVGDHTETLLGIDARPEGFFDRFLNRVPDPFAEKARVATEEAIREATPLEIELPFDRPDGRRIWLFCTSTPASREVEGGTELRFNGMMLDITERKKAEKELQESRERLQMAVDGGNIGTWDWDLGSGRVVFNQQWAEMLGYTRGELDFHFGVWEDLVHPEDLERAMNQLESYIEGEAQAYDPEIRMRTKSGRWKWVKTIGKVIDRDEDGKVTRAAGIHLDIDERKRAEDALREREAQLRGLTNSIPGVVFQSYARPGREYGFYYVSKHAEDLLGIDRDPSRFFERCMRRVPEDSRGALRGTLDRAVEKEAPFEFESPFVKPSGETIWLLGTATPERSGDELIYNGVILDITERKKHKRHLKRTVERVTDAIIEVDADWQCTLVNDRAERLSDRKEDVLLGKDFWEVFDQALDTRFEEEYRGVMESREPTRFESYYSGLDGWVDVQVYPTEDGGLAFYFEDITERKRREQHIERQNDLFRRAQEIADVGAWEYELQADRLNWTEQVYKICGIPLTEDLTVEKALSAYHPEDQPTIREAFTRGARGGEPYDLKLRLVPSEGEERWVRTRGEPVLEGGTITSVRGTIQDITEQKAAEEEVRSTKSYYEQILRQIPIDLAVFTPDAEFEYINPQSVRDPEMRDWLKGRTNEDYFREHREETEVGRARDEAVRQAARKKETIEIEETIQSADGPRHFLRVHGPLTDLEGRVTNVVAFGIDITDQKRREQELIEAKQEAERASRLKSAFLANMSHEIRTPLTSILGFAEAIGQETREASAAEAVDLTTLTQFSALIEKSGRRLMETLTSVLNLSKLEAGEMDLAAEPVNLAAEAEETAKEFRPRAEEAGIDLRVETEDSVWARADEGGIQMILRNLLSNAIKYTEGGGTVWVRTRHDEEVAVLEVEDNGIGMDPGQVERLFEPFKQASEGTAREYEGTGLGLAIVRRMAERIGGEVGVETEQGTGSRFTVRLSRTAADVMGGEQA